MELEFRVSRSMYFGFFLTTLSVLMYEILLTRIFSVIAYYHFAFMAISIAMFGMTFGALLVYLLPRYQSNENIQQKIITAFGLFALTIVVSFLTLLSMPLTFDLTVRGMLTTLIVYLIISIPFIFSGIGTCLVLTKFTQQINKLYATDLFGAAVGCIAIIFALNTFSAPTCVFLVAAIAGMGTILLSWNPRIADAKLYTSAFVGILILISIANIALEQYRLPIFRLSWIKNQYEPNPLYEKWNSFSRLAVSGNPSEAKKPFGWGLSDRYLKDISTQYLWLTIDSSAGTILTHYDNDITKLDYLKYDVTNIAHYLKPNADVLIIGVGGGRDILSALSFNQNSITGVELNKNIFQLLTNQFADYTGHLNNIASVTLINDEARSYITRIKNQYDIIQMSLIDTWAATAAGAFTLSENGLYTIESWELFIRRLNPGGILTVSRWYFPKKPAEMYRVAALASQALRNLNITDPSKHIMILASPIEQFGAHAATLLLSKEAFTAAQVKTVESLAKKLNFIIIKTPSMQNHSILDMLLSQKTIAPLLQQLDFDISPPTDNKPFFFQMIKLDRILNLNLWNHDDYFSLNSHGVVVVGLLLITVLLLTLFCILIPLMISTKKSQLKNANLLLTYFASIGLGFMLIEISQIQRLSLFLGHPTYGLSVVLFSLLLSCGLGSLFGSNNNRDLAYPKIGALLLLLLILGLFGYFSTAIVSHFQSATTLLRIVVSVLILFPMGFFLGVALPFGLQLASRLSPALTPWLWGMNGATSICGSVLAIAIALTSGISTVFWVGVVCYVIAVTVYIFQFIRTFLDVNKGYNDVLS